MLNGKPTALSKSQLVIAGLLTLMIVGCTTPQVIEDTGVIEESAKKPVSINQETLEASDSDSQASELSAELLYDILLASIANQRQQPEISLEALSRAVYLSRDKRLNANAIQLALHLKDYQKAIELSRLMLVHEPDNFRIYLALANAQIKSNQLTDAGNTLIDLAKSQQPGLEAILQEIAGLIARQEEQAVDNLKNRFMLAAETDDPLLVFTAALLASRLKDTDQFRRLLDKSLDLNPNWETAAILKLTDLSEQGPDKFESWANEFLLRNPDTERFRIQYARLLIQIEKLELALAQLTAVIDHNPESVDALFIAAVVNMDLKEFTDAEKMFGRYIEISGNGDQARLYLAQILIDQERYDEATPLLRQIQTSALYLDAQIVMSGVIAKQSNVDAGLSHLRNIDVRGEADSVRLILEQDLLLRDYNMLERSLELLSGALMQWPDQPDLLYSRGLLAAQLDKIELIEKDMRTLIKLQPENAHAYNALGYTLADQTDRYDEALTLISKALEFLPDDAYILDSMGWVHYRIGDYEKALEYLERAMELKQDAEIAAHFGEVLWISGNRARAEKVWNRGKIWGPENATLQKTIDKFIDQQEGQRSVLQWRSERLLAILTSTRLQALTA